jgi:hypothetical protein
MKKLLMLALVLTTLFTSAFSADPVNKRMLSGQLIRSFIVQNLLLAGR